MLILSFISNCNTFNKKSKDDLIILKKNYKDSTGHTSSPNHGFFASKLQKTKQSLSKAFSKGIEKEVNKSLNLSTNSSNSSSTSSFHASSSSYSASNLTELSIIKHPNNLLRKSSLVSSNPSLANNVNICVCVLCFILEFNTYIYSIKFIKHYVKPSLSATSTKTNLHEIFELDKLINDLSLSKTYSDSNQREQSVSLEENYESLDNDEPDDQEVGVTSVKEQAKKLNRLSTKSDLRNQNEVIPRVRNNSINKDLSQKVFFFSVHL